MSPRASSATPGRRRHRERDAVASAGGKLHDSAVALVSDPDVAEGGDRERHRVVQLAGAAPGRAEDGQYLARRGELHHPVVAGVGHPDVPGRVGGDSGRLVQVLAEGGQLPPGGGELQHPVVAGVGDPDAAGRAAATPAGAASVCCPTARRNRGACASGSGRVAADARGAGRASAGGPEASGAATRIAASTLAHTRAITRGPWPPAETSGPSTRNVTHSGQSRKAHGRRRRHGAQAG